jgi:hypothetical protein
MEGKKQKEVDSSIVLYLYRTHPPPSDLRGTSLRKIGPKMLKHVTSACPTKGSGTVNYVPLTRDSQWSIVQTAWPRQSGGRDREGLGRGASGVDNKDENRRECTFLASTSCCGAVTIWPAGGGLVWFCQIHDRLICSQLGEHYPPSFLAYVIR